MAARTAIIRTSDRIAFKRCRRKWGLTSHLRRNRTESEASEYLWLGSGGHYALEDYHGWNYYKHPVEAYRAYAHAQRLWVAQKPSRKLPASFEEQVTLGEALLDYYLTWLVGRDPYETYWHNGEPQVEVKCTALLPFTNQYYDEVYYQATFDRVVVIDDELWILDYKFYNRDWTPNLDFDAQMSAYIWLAQVLYNRPVRGAIVQKHFKTVPEMPRILSSGRLSSDVSQATTHRLYREALVGMYGTVDKAPLANRNCLNELAMLEGPNHDKFIARHDTIRSDEQIAATGEQIMMEVSDMLNDELPLYKNDTKDCGWDCNYRDVCLMMDDGVDWEAAFLEMTTSRVEEDESWKKYLPHLTNQ